jgi:hypothetical protein
MVFVWRAVWSGALRSAIAEIERLWKMTKTRRRKQNERFALYAVVSHDCVTISHKASSIL